MTKQILKFLVISFLLVIPFFCWASFDDLGSNENNPVIEKPEKPFGDNETIGLSVNKSVMTLEADPNSRVRFSINVANIIERKQNITAEMSDFIADNNNNITIISGENEVSGMKNWIKLDQTNWTLNSGDSLDLSGEVIVPPTATVGSHYAFILIHALPDYGDANFFDKPVVGGQIGVYVLMNVRGAVSKSGQISQFKAPTWGNRPIKISTVYENTGNTFYVPYGEFLVQDWLIGKIHKIEAEKHIVLPMKKYSFDVDWVTSSDFGVYALSTKFIDGEGKIQTAEKYYFGKFFFVFPGILLLLILGYFVFRAIISKRKRKNQTFNKKKYKPHYNDKNS